MLKPIRNRKVKCMNARRAKAHVMNLCFLMVIITPPLHSPNTPSPPHHGFLEVPSFDRVSCGSSRSRPRQRGLVTGYPKVSRSGPGLKNTWLGAIGAVSGPWFRMIGCRALSGRILPPRWTCGEGFSERYPLDSPEARDAVSPVSSGREMNSSGHKSSK